jgi:hypothetical protein
MSTNTVSKRKRTLSPEEKAAKEAKAAFTKSKGALVKGLFKADEEDITDEKLLEQTSTAKKAKNAATEANKVSKEETQNLVDMCLSLWEENPDNVPAELKPLFEAAFQAFENLESLASTEQKTAEIIKMAKASGIDMDEFKAFIKSRRANSHSGSASEGSEEDGEINTDL